MDEAIEIERRFMDAVENPKPAPEYLKEMFRRYAKPEQGDGRIEKDFGYAPAYMPII